MREIERFINPKVAAATTVGLSSLACTLGTEGALAGLGFVATSALFSGTILGPVIKTHDMEDRERAGQINTMFAMGGAGVGAALGLVLSGTGAEIGMGVEAGIGAAMGLKMLAHKIFERKKIK